MSTDEQDRVHVAVRRHLDGPGAAATWDIRQQQLQIVRAAQIDWRNA
ncbi:MAG: hypothetical protein ACRDTD_04985 [Pseudonocardiaceae bacterium]